MTDVFTKDNHISACLSNSTTFKRNYGGYKTISEKVSPRVWQDGKLKKPHFVHPDFSQWMSLTTTSSSERRPQKDLSICYLIMIRDILVVTLNNFYFLIPLKSPTFHLHYNFYFQEKRFNLFTQIPTKRIANQFLTRRLENFLSNANMSLFFVYDFKEGEWIPAGIFRLCSG